MQRKNWLPQSTDLCLNPVTQLQPNLSRALQVNTLSSIAQAVEICILNSIDAGGREIHVQLDAGSHSFVVTDDGCGLRQEDLALLSSWDLPSKSSKNLDQKRSGLGFAALCSTAVVEVCSRASGKFETFSCLLRGGQVLQLKLAAEQRSRSGTVITVKDLFFNRPVIRKALDAAGRAKRDIERCRDTIARLTLFNPDVTITLYDRQRRTFIAKHIRGRRPTESASRFFSCDRPEYVTPLAATRPPWRVSGWAVRPPLGHPTTARQCICVNGQPVEAPEVAEVLEYLYGDVYRVNAKLQRAFGELLALKKASNLHPMFAVDIRCDSGAAYEILRDGERRVLHAAAWRPLIEAVKAAVVTAWEPVVGQAMLSSPTAVAHNEPPHSSSHNGDSRSHTWSAPVYSGLKHSSSGALRLASSSTQRMALRGPSTSSAPMASPAVAALAGPLAPEVSSAATAPAANLPVEWPSERMSLLESEPKQDRGSVERDPASGMAAWRRQRSSRLGFHPDSSDALFSSKRPRSGSLSAPAAGSRSHASALDGILSGWVNPAMMPAAASGTSESVPSLETLEAAVFAPLRPKVLDREGFYGARALAQVDLKFVPIVCSNGVLAVVDQHAADERVCLERLRRKLIGDDGWPRDDAGACMALTTPQPLRLAADEAPLLDAYGAAAAAWGWRWAVRGGTNGCDVDVTHVPLIAHRALTSTDLRVYLHRMAETRGGAGMPEGVTRVLNSVACRSAIMFGDELGPSRAQQLVDELQQTQMCFVCAHGRPTTVPLVDLSLLRKAAAAQAAQRAVGRPEVVPLGGLKGRLLEALQRS